MKREGNRIKEMRKESKEDRKEMYR